MTAKYFSKPHLENLPFSCKKLLSKTVPYFAYTDCDSVLFTGCRTIPTDISGVHGTVLMCSAWPPSTFVKAMGRVTQSTKEGSWVRLTSDYLENPWTFVRDWRQGNRTLGDHNVRAQDVYTSSVLHWQTPSTSSKSGYWWIWSSNFHVFQTS